MSRQQRLTLVATILGSTVVFLDSTVVNVALPAIAGERGHGADCDRGEGQPPAASKEAPAPEPV